MAVHVIVVLFSIILEVTGQRDTARSMGTPNPWYMPASREAPVPAAYLRKLTPFLVAHRMRPVGTQRRARTYVRCVLFFHTKLRFYTYYALPRLYTSMLRALDAAHFSMLPRPTSRPPNAPP
jgi:hypothetical protein